MYILPLLLCILNCSWNYRFDSENNHFNVVYPDKNAVYFGMIVPPGTNSVVIQSDNGHPIADYFSIQVYDSSDLTNSIYNYNDCSLLTLDELTVPRTGYKLSMDFDENNAYFFLFRIYNPRLPNYWAGLPPKTYVNGKPVPLCDIDYTQQGNIYSNITKRVYPETNTVCIKNEAFVFMDVPAGSLANADANYMISCIQSDTTYIVTIRLPQLMCYLDHPYINEYYDLRYASLSIVSTASPRPTITTYEMPCDVPEFSIEIRVDDTVPFPGLLYRQLLPNRDFQNSIAHAKSKCYKYVHSEYCIISVMGDYYPRIQKKECN